MYKVFRKWGFRYFLELVLTAAESGMLVLTTIHSGSVAQVMDRIASLVLKGVIVQNLFPRISGDEGLVVGSEILLVNDLSRKVIRDGEWKSIPDILLRGKSHGMQSMQDFVEDLVRKHIIDMHYLKEYSPALNQ